MPDESKTASPRLAHPLSGADPITLMRVLGIGGGVGRQRIPQLLVAAGSSLGRLPFTLGERGYLAGRLALKPARIEKPIFILGHWRSGTTHLYNILSRSDQFAWLGPLETGLPWESLSLVRLFRPWLEKALPNHRFIDSIPVNPDSPQEDEIALANMTPISFYHALYFPKRFDRLFDKGVFLDDGTDAEAREWERTFLQLSRKVALQSPGRTLVVKNPVYTARVKHILRIFPDARFIHIHRNPHEVFRSMRNFHKKLLAEFSLQPGQPVDIDAAILRTYARMMDCLIEDTADLTSEQFFEVGYASLDEDPLGVIEQAFEKLGIENFAESKENFSDYLRSIKKYEKNNYEPDREALNTVGAAWSKYFNHFGYQLEN